MITILPIASKIYFPPLSQKQRASLKRYPHYTEIDYIHSFFHIFIYAFKFCFISTFFYVQHNNPSRISSSPTSRIKQSLRTRVPTSIRISLSLTSFTLKFHIPQLIIIHCSSFLIPKTELLNLLLYKYITLTYS